MFSIDYAVIFESIPRELATVLIAMLPIAELRAAIPVAIEGFGMSIWGAYFWSVIGNLIPAVLLLMFLEPIAQFLMKRSELFERFFTWIFNRTRKRFSARSGRYGKFVALILFVAIPLPVTGAWTGSAAAFLFNVSFKRSLAAITIGVLIAGVIVTAATVGISALL